MLDLDPAQNGQKGQLLGFVTECDVLLPGESIAGFLARSVELIEAGALHCLPAEGQEYAFEVVPADRTARSVYQTRWDGLFDPARPVKKPRGKKK